MNAIEGICISGIVSGLSKFAMPVGNACAGLMCWAVVGLDGSFADSVGLVGGHVALNAGVNENCFDSTCCLDFSSRN